MVMAGCTAELRMLLTRCVCVDEERVSDGVNNMLHRSHAITNVSQSRNAYWHWVHVAA